MKKRCVVYIMLAGVLGVGLPIAVASVGAAVPQALTVGEGFESPLGFHDPTPTFSWKLPIGVAKQTAYHIQVKDGWDSGWVESGASHLVPYGGKPFQSREAVEWRVRYRDQGGKSGWSDLASFELGLLSSQEWKAKWISIIRTLDGCGCHLGGLPLKKKPSASEGRDRSGAGCAFEPSAACGFK